MEQLGLKSKEMSTIYVVSNLTYRISNNGIGSELIVSIHFETMKEPLHV